MSASSTILLGNAESYVPPQTHWTKICILTGFPCDSSIYCCLRSAGMEPSSCPFYPSDSLSLMAAANPPAHLSCQYSLLQIGHHCTGLSSFSTCHLVSDGPKLVLPSVCLQLSALIIFRHYVSIQLECLSVLSLCIYLVPAHPVCCSWMLTRPYPRLRNILLSQLLT